MSNAGERHLRSTTRRAREGLITTTEAIDEITARGEYLAIGMNFSAEHHHPRPAVSSFNGPSDPASESWAFKVAANETGRGLAIVRASAVAATAIHAALGKNFRFPDSRLSPSPNTFYHRAVYGWAYDEATGLYRRYMHEHLLAAVTNKERTPDDAVIADVDFVRRDGFTISIPDEPGHYGSPNVEEREDTLPLRMGEIRANLATAAVRGALSTYDYRPLPIPRQA